MRQLARLGIALLCATAAGCTYGGLATSPDGRTLYVARNGILNLGRRIYHCSLSQSGEVVDCHATEAP